MARELEQPADKPEVFTDAAGTPSTVPVLDNTGVTGLYTSSEGLKGDAVWGTRGRWAQLTGTLNKETVTIAILDHPGQSRVPHLLARARLWPVRSEPAGSQGLRPQTSRVDVDSSNRASPSPSCTAFIVLNGPGGDRTRWNANTGPSPTPESIPRNEEPTNNGAAGNHGGRSRRRLRGTALPRRTGNRRTLDLDAAARVASTSRLAGLHDSCMAEMHFSITSRWKNTSVWSAGSRSSSLRGWLSPASDRHSAAPSTRSRLLRRHGFSAAHAAALQRSA